MADFEKLITRSSPAVQELASRTRASIRKAVPRAQEKVFFGWRINAFSFDGSMKTMFCAISPLKEYVNIYLGRGTDLKDPAKLLEGAGKKMRHVKVKDAALLKNKALKKLVQDAAKLALPAKKGKK